MEKVNLIIDTLTESVPCGGARVKTLKDYDSVSQKNFNSKTYLYKSPQQNIESGIIGLFPKYRFSEICTTQGIETIWDNGQATVCNYWFENTITDISANSYGTNNPLEEYHISYTDITEQLDGNGYNVYHFSSLADIPDDENVTNAIQINSAYVISVCPKTPLYWKPC
jgi:hypothetical protein